MGLLNRLFGGRAKSKEVTTPFLFSEAKNTAVFTTKDAFQGAPILFVSHNDDGDWQFHTSDSPKLENAMIVCLEDITKLDTTINELHNLQMGWRAWRKSKNADWEYAEDDPVND
jgi:hypothetical protein